jgi:hypothetical protein
MMSVTNTNLNFRITHSSKTKKQASKNNNYRGTIFFVFLIKKMQGKNKLKQNNNKVKGWKQETILAEIFFLPGNGARKLVGGAVLIYEFYICNRPVGKPQEKVMMSIAASLPSVVKPRFIEPVGEKTKKVDAR